MVTYGFALVVSSFFVATEFFGDWLPPSRIDRPAVFGVIKIDTETRFYFFCVVMLGIVMFLVRGYGTAAPAGHSSRCARTRTPPARTASAPSARPSPGSRFSGFLAALAGVLFVHQQQGLGTAVFAPDESLATFSSVVIGGMTSVPGAILGSVYVRGTEYFLPGNWTFIASSFGLLIVLWLLPRGLGGSLALLRDMPLRRVAERRGIVVPSLLADRRVDEPPPESTERVLAAVGGSEAHIEEAS